MSCFDLPERMKESTFKKELSSIVRVSNLGRSIMFILLHIILENRSQERENIHKSTKNCGNKGEENDED